MKPPKNILRGIIALAPAMLFAAGGPAKAAEIRLCGREIRTVPLSDERDVQSALVQGFAVVNSGTQPVTLLGIDLNLKEKGQVRDSRQLLAADIARAAKQAPQIDMIAQVFPSQFCNGTMLKGTKLATSETLAPGEALVFMHQPFVWKGERDEIEIVAKGKREGQAQVDTVELALVAGASKTKLLFPVAGRSFVAVAASFHTPHRWAGIEEFAHDIVMLGNSGSTHRGKGTKLSDYAAYGKPVRAAAAGKVVVALDTSEDNAAMLKRPDEADDAYLTRLQQGQMALLAKGMESVLGNHIVIDHGNGEFSIYAHMKQGSLRVKSGAGVKAGDIIGALGSSGNSTEPHLHFQICNTPDIAACHPIPLNFKGYRLPLELAPRSIQSGDIVETTE
jgi:Peptidase family M23